MKKLMILAVAAIALVACSRTFEHHAVEGTPIGFGTWTEQLTKVRTPGQGEFGTGDTFEVYAYKVNGSTNNVVFNGDVVTYGTPTWTYTNTRYWDPSATSYTFYAVSPSGVVAAANVTPTTGAIAATNVTFNGNDSDILVANQKVVTPTGSPATYSTDPVQMQFKHIASLVDFKVKKHSDLNAATVAITSFSITNIDNTGNFAVATGYTTDVLPSVTWTATGRETFKNNSDDSGKHGVTEVTLPTNVATSGNDFLINNLVIMPQSFRSAANSDSNIQTVSISYTITDAANNVSTYSSSFELKSFDNVDDTDNEDTIIGGWEKGKHYTFVITINANAIKFTGSIVDWTTETGYHYLVN